MPRLTNDHRTLIVRKVTRHGFLAQVMALSADWAKLADDVYQELFAKELPLLKAVPERWLCKNHSVPVTIGDNTFNHLNFGTTFSNEAHRSIVNIHTEIELEERVVPPGYNAAGIIDPGHPLSKTFRALTDRSDSLDCDIRDAKGKVTALLNTVGSDTALLKVWPEVAPFLAEVMGPGSVPLPAMPTAHLNAILDLPIGA